MGVYVGLTSHNFISPRGLHQKSRGAFEGGASQAQERFVSRGGGWPSVGLPWVMWETQPMLTWVMLLIGDEQLPSYMGVSKKWVGPPKSGWFIYSGKRYSNG